jgi:PKHD-type hydroxylase
MIDIGNWTICSDSSSPMTPIILEGEFDKEELSRIKTILTDVKLTDFKNDDLSFKSCWINYTNDTAWLYGRLAKIFEYANNAYKFSDLLMIEKIAYFEFNENDHHDWHTDLDMGIPFSSRRLGAIVNLSASDDYRGGNLEFMTSNKPYSVSRVIGTTSISPSYLLRKFEQVTSGKKRILVAWINSPTPV